MEPTYQNFSPPPDCRPVCISPLLGEAAVWGNEQNKIGFTPKETPRTKKDFQK